MGFTVLLNVSSASRINLAISSLQVGMSSISATLCPQFQTPRSGSALAIPSLSRSNLMYAPTSPNFNAFPLSCSIAFTASASLLRMTRDEALKGLPSTRVSLGPAINILDLKASGKMEHSTVALNLVPIWTPAAPKANAARSWAPVATPPESKNGIFNSFLANAACTKIPISASPGSLHVRVEGNSQKK